MYLHLQNAIGKSDCMSLKNVNGINIVQWNLGIIQG